MIYTVHTDGAADEKADSVGCAYLIITPYTYVSSGKKRVYGTNNIFVAEVVSIGLAAAYLCTAADLNKQDTVVFNSDSLLALDFCRKHIKSERKYYNKETPELSLSVEALRHLASKCRVGLLKVKGHKKVESGSSLHIFVDRLAKLALKGR